MELASGSGPGPGGVRIHRGRPMSGFWLRCDCALSDAIRRWEAHDPGTCPAGHPAVRPAEPARIAAVTAKPSRSRLHTILRLLTALAAAGAAARWPAAGAGIGAVGVAWTVIPRR